MWGPCAFTARVHDRWAGILSFWFLRRRPGTSGPERQLLSSRPHRRLRGRASPISPVRAPFPRVLADPISPSRDSPSSALRGRAFGVWSLSRWTNALRASSTRSALAFCMPGRLAVFWRVAAGRPTKRSGTRLPTRVLVRDAAGRHPTTSSSRPRPTPSSPRSSIASSSEGQTRSRSTSLYTGAALRRRVPAGTRRRWPSASLRVRAGAYS